MSVDTMIEAGYNDARTGNTACVFSEGTAAHAAWMIGFNGYYAGRSVEALQREAAFDACPADDDYAGLPNEDGIDANGQNVFCPGPF